jgi:hypothetical protein
LVRHQPIEHLGHDLARSVHKKGSFERRERETTMKNAASILAAVTIFAASSAVAGESVRDVSEADASWEEAQQANTVALQEVRDQLTDCWERARALRQVMDGLRESPERNTSRTRAALASLRLDLDDCRREIDGLRALKRGLAEERIALQGNTRIEEPRAFAEAGPVTQSR